MVKSKMMRWEEHVARMGKMRNMYKMLVGEPEGKRVLGRPRRRWEDDIKMGREKNGWQGVGRIYLAEDGDRSRTLVEAVMKLRVS
jgi:hypothetical protein